MKARFSCPIACALVTILFARGVEADCDFSGMTGWTVYYSGTVTGYIDDDDEQEIGFRGCKHGRILILSDGLLVSCTTYGYDYSYKPDILIIRKKFIREELGDFYIYKACIDDDWYDIRLSGDWSAYENRYKKFLE